MYSSGSTKFGDTSDDIHQMTGSLKVSGNISSSGNILAEDFNVNNDILPVSTATSNLGSTSKSFLYTNTYVVQSGGELQFMAGGTSERMRVAATGKVGIGATIPPEKLTVTGNISSSGNLIMEGHITASGNISASGTGTNYFGSAIQLPSLKKIQWVDGNQHIYGTSTMLYIEGDDRIQMVADNDVIIDSPILNLRGDSFDSNIKCNVTASGDISASGTVTMLTASIGGGTFTSASLAAGGSGGGSWVGTATSDLNMDSNDIYGIQHITASGNISSSGNIEANNLYLHPESGKVYFTADENEYIAGNSTYLELNAGGGMYFKIGGAHKFAYRNSKFGIGDFGTSNPAEKLTVEGNISSSGFISTLSHITASGNISSSGTIIATPQLQYNTSSISSTGNVQGDIIKFGNSTTVAGAIYAHTGSGWSLAHSGSSGAASSSLGLAVGTNSTTHGMLLRGMANIGYDPGGDNGCALYLESPGSASSTVPSTTGHVSRVVGWNYGSDTVYFNPDNTWVLLA